MQYFCIYTYIYVYTYVRTYLHEYLYDNTQMWSNKEIFADMHFLDEKN